MKPGRKQDTGKKRLFTAAVLTVGMFCMAGTAVGVYLSRSRPPEKPAGLVYESNVIVGDIPGKSPEDIQRELDSVVEEGMLAMSDVYKRQVFCRAWTGGYCDRIQGFGDRLYAARLTDSGRRAERRRNSSSV